MEIKPTTSYTIVEPLGYLSPTYIHSAFIGSLKTVSAALSDTAKIDRQGTRTKYARLLVGLDIHVLQCRIPMCFIVQIDMPV